MTFNLTASLLVILALLTLSAFFAGSETALTAVSKARMHRLAGAGSWRAKQAISLIADRERLIGALLLGNTFINILASAVATSVALQYFGTSGVVIATVAMTGIILIFTDDHAFGEPLAALGYVSGHAFLRAVARKVPDGAAVARAQ